MRALRSGPGIASSLAAAFLLAIVFGLLAWSARAQEEDPPPPPADQSTEDVNTSKTGIAKIPVRVVNGRLVVNCQLAARRRVPVNLFIDLEAPVGLLLHNRAASGIVAEEDDGTPNVITINLPDLNMKVPQREVGEEEPFERFTKWYSKELGEQAVVGTLGAKVLSQYHVVLDLRHGMMELSAPHDPDPKAAEPIKGSYVTPVTLVNDVVWASVSYGAGRRGAFGVGTAKYDTWIDAGICDELHKPAGDVGEVKFGPFDLAKFVPFRPEEIRQIHPDGVFGMSGLNLLQHFRVEIDRVNRVARWTNTAPPRFPKADLAYFIARAKHEPGAIEGWLDANQKERLAPEAADLLVDMRLDALADDGAMRKAMDWVMKTRPEDLQTTGALELMKKMFQSARPDYVLAAATLGLKNPRADRYPDSVHKVHARMGSVLLDQGKGLEAWRHLLSAAFGMPDDGPLNLDLARYYEGEKRWLRAYSRYVQALLSADSGPRAIDGLERVGQKLDEPFSVDAIEKLIEGKVEGFGAAARYKPESRRSTKKIPLVEIFTNAHWIGESGMALGADGVRDHFGDHAIQLVYHVAEGELEPEPLVNAASVAALDAARERNESMDALAGFVDGVVPIPPGAPARFKAKVFDAYKSAVMSRIDLPTDYTIELTGEANARGLTGRVVVRGEQRPDVHLEILLVERGVLFPGKSKVVIQRNVVRAHLLGDGEGEPLAIKQGTMTVPFSAVFADVQKANADFLEAQEKAGKARTPRSPVRIDPRQATIVALVRNAGSGEVYQAAKLVPTFKEDAK